MNQRNQPTPPASATDSAVPAPEQTPADPALQGEGNYTAARRHREAAESFVAAGRVEPAARDAAPASDAEAQDLIAAEEAGRAHAKR